ncbi:MAG: energy-coupling factor ABC transporter ATP-binding protein [Candidatus Nezhaarchaeota archaeon]|nr:energy-coupling factor ABC transporter ATP-binding protein [Candidatus Nezhaarchaeota archaeon]
MRLRSWWGFLSAIVVEDLWYSYPNHPEPVLKGVDLKIDAGTFTLIAGPSGCGKTTLCRCFNGLIPHFYGGRLRGKVLVGNVNVASRPVHELAKRVGMVFQEPEDQLICLSVEREVAFALENLGLPKEEIKRRVEEALTALKIASLRDKPPFELSGGEQQKVALAAALALRPQILVLDEPTSNLDPASAHDFLSTLASLNREGLTIVLVEHRLDAVARLADLAVLMDKGKVVLVGDPREVLASEEAEKLGVAVPRSIKVYRELAARGVQLPKIPLTPEELAEELVGFLERYSR